MQNRVFNSRDEAVSAAVGTLDLETCRQCGLTFNGSFDESLVTYDQTYDNRVPSATFRQYYEKLARRLAALVPLDGRLVVDVGCGKGEFLRILCALSPNVRGLGIDPSYDGPPSPLPNLKFVPELFQAEHVREKPALVVCRHVLEHMARPAAFLRSIRAVLESCPETPFMLEVPDLDWILRERAFWDFCYEHCNYFTSYSLANVARAAGFEPGGVESEFGGQYLWLIGRIGPEVAARHPRDDACMQVVDYARRERELIELMRTRVERDHERGTKTIVWGMATKGVVFCNLVDPEARLLDACIDINEQKQGKFIPRTGHRIEPARALARFTGTKTQVIVMNPNYLAEIAAQCREAAVEPTFIDASGNSLA